MYRIIALVLCCVVSSAYAEKLPYTTFGELPVIEQPAVSPDGRHIAAVLNGADGPTIVVTPFGSTELSAVARLRYSEHRLDWIRWANNDRILLSVSEPGGKSSDRFRVHRLYQVGLDGEGMQQIRRKMLEKEYMRLSEWEKKLPTNNILAILPDDPDHILMQIYDERDTAFAVYKVNITNNDFEKLFPNTYDVSNWRADEKGNIVYGWEFNSNTNELTYWHRPVGADKWEELDTRKLYGSESFWPAGIEGNEAVVLSNRELGREAAWRYDIRTGEYTELLFAADQHDLAGAILSNDQTRVLGVYYYDNFRVDQYFDESSDQKARLVKSSFPGHHTSIVSRSQDENQMIVALYKDNEPQKYVWVDLAKKAAKIWYSQHPGLEGVIMPSVQPIEFEARDGRTVSGYLTMPLQWEGEKPSLIVHPHGGPFSRDYQYFNTWVQFFANRGHAVLQVNFRGSEGFGTEFEQAGWREWGQAMQDDIYDGINWVEQQGLTDPARKCVVGASYGGYVALVAAYQKPRDFRCIASIAGISDLYDLARNSSLYRSRKQRIKNEIGDPTDEEDKQMLHEYSPVNHVPKIKAPLLVVHGTEDTRVRLKQTRHFYNVAKSEGIDIEYLELEDGTHFLDEYNNRLAVFAALDKFLEEHL